MIAVTTFSKEGYEQYGRNCLESFVGNWPCKIHAYYEGEEEPDFKHEQIVYKPLEAIGKLATFLLSIANMDYANGVIEDKYYIFYDIWRFCRKSFVQMNTRSDMVFWIDADVNTLKPIPEEFLVNLFQGKAYCYLGRDSYTETGFIGFNHNHSDIYRLLRAYENVYMNRRIFTLKGWNDCFAFDFARKDIEGNNLSPWGKGMDHVFHQSVLGEYMDHLKGLRKDGKESPERTGGRYDWTLQTR